jgi:hypothetical protein
VERWPIYTPLINRRRSLVFWYWLLTLLILLVCVHGERGHGYEKTMLSVGRLQKFGVNHHITYEINNNYI